MNDPSWDVGGTDKYIVSTSSLCLLQFILENVTRFIILIHSHTQKQYLLLFTLKKS